MIPNAYWMDEFPTHPENWVIDIPKDSILVSGYLNLNTLSRLTGFSLDTLRRLNPHIISHFLPKNSQQVKVHLPSNRFTYFEQNRVQIMDSARVDLSAPELMEDDTLETEEPVPVAKRYTYRVKGGDNLSTVSRRLGLSVMELKRLNRIKGSHLRKGQVLTYFKLVKTKQRITKKSNKRSYVKSKRKVKHKKKKSKSKKRRKRR